MTQGAFQVNDSRRTIRVMIYERGVGALQANLCDVNYLC